jgi:hypothetical protein
VKRALFKSCNLLGDGLYVGPVAEKWFREHGQEYEEIYLQTVPNHAVAIYEGMGVPWKITMERPPGPFDFEVDVNVAEAFNITGQKKCHLVNAYAELVGVSPEGLKPVPNYKPTPMQVPEEHRNLALVSMFSESCSSRNNPEMPPTKMPPWPKWKPMLETLRAEYGKVRFLGAPGDKVPAEYAELLGIREEEYLLAVPIPLLANIMQHCACVVTVDNGMGHLAASQGARQLYLASYRLALYFVVPWANNRLRVVHTNPSTISAESLNAHLQSAIRDWRASGERYDATV